MDIWKTILEAFIMGAISSVFKLFTSWLKSRREREELTNKPKKNPVRTKTKIMYLLVAIFSLAIPSFEISIFVRDPVLSNVPWLCVGLSVLVFNLSMFYFDFILKKIVDVFRSQQSIIESNYFLLKDTVSSLSGVSSVSSSLLEQIQKLSDRLDKLESKK